MSMTMGYHVVISGYGQWLPGDARGHWSSVWDDRIGFTEHHRLHAGDPARVRFSRERLRHDPARLSDEMQAIVIDTLGRCVTESDWRAVAASVEPTHTHLLLTRGQRPIAGTVRWIKDRTAKAIHRAIAHAGPVWCEGSWRTAVFDEDTWDATRRYIERHNERRGVSARPYAGITD